MGKSAVAWVQGSRGSGGWGVGDDGSSEAAVAQDGTRRKMRLGVDRPQSHRGDLGRSSATTTCGGFEGRVSDHVRSCGTPWAWWSAIRLKREANRPERLPHHSTLQALRAHREIDAGELQQVAEPVEGT